MKSGQGLRRGVYFLDLRNLKVFLFLEKFLAGPPAGCVPFRFEKFASVFISGKIWAGPPAGCALF